MSEENKRVLIVDALNAYLRAYIVDCCALPVQKVVKLVTWLKPSGH